MKCGLMGIMNGEEIKRRFEISLKKDGSMKLKPKKRKELVLMSKKKLMNACR